MPDDAQGKPRLSMSRIERRLCQAAAKQDGEQEKALTDYKLEAAQHYVSKEYLGESERRILDSIHDLPRRIDHVFHTRQEKRKGPDRGTLQLRHPVPRSVRAERFDVLSP